MHETFTEARDDESCLGGADEQRWLVSSPTVFASRPWRGVVMAAGVVAVAVFLALYFPQRDDTSGAVVGAAFAFGAAALGLAAVGRARSLPKRSGTEHARLVGLSLIAGSTLGIANLMANYGIARLDPRIYAQMSEQFPQFSVWSVLFSGVIVEEIGFRLFLMGGIAWLLTRFTDDRRTIFLVAMIVSALLFGLFHVLPSSRPTVGVVHATGVVLKTGAAGLFLGWIFWRWGLPYSIACHSTANAAHLLAMPVLF